MDKVKVSVRRLLPQSVGRQLVLLVVVVYNCSNCSRFELLELLEGEQESQAKLGGVVGVW